VAIRLLESRVAADDEGGERLRCGLGFGGERAGGFVDCGKIRSGPLRPVDDELSGRPRGTAAYGSRGKRGALAGREPERLREQRDALPPVAPFERADPVDAHPSTFGERFLGERPAARRLRRSSVPNSEEPGSFSSFTGAGFAFAPASFLDRLLSGSKPPSTRGAG